MSSAEILTSLRHIEKLYAEVYAPHALQCITRNSYKWCRGCWNNLRADALEHICHLSPVKTLLLHPRAIYFGMMERDSVWLELMDRIKEECAAKFFVTDCTSRADMFRSLTPLIGENIRRLLKFQMNKTIARQ